MTNWFKNTTWDSSGVELWCYSVTLASAFIGIIWIWFMPRASTDCFLFTKVIAQRSFASKPLHRPLNQTQQLIMRQSVPAINYASVCVCVWVSGKESNGEMKTKNMSKKKKTRTEVLPHRSTSLLQIINSKPKTYVLYCMCFFTVLSSDDTETHILGVNLYYITSFIYQRNVRYTHQPLHLVQLQHNTYI